MSRVSFAIQNHPDRERLAVKLAREIGGEVEIVVDPEPDGYRSPWRTYRHALECTPGFDSVFTWKGSATHRLILQDDVVVCRGFRAAAEAAIAAKPEDLIAFFVAGSPQEYAVAVQGATARGLSWASLGNSRWCPALALSWPVHLIHPLLAYVDEQNWPVQFRADDEIVGRWARENKLDLLATAPSLVEHPDDVPSLIGLRACHGRDSGRIAACWIGDCDPASIDWTLGP